MSKAIDSRKKRGEIDKTKRRPEVFIVKYDKEADLYALYAKEVRPFYYDEQHRYRWVRLPYDFLTYEEAALAAVGIHPNMRATNTKDIRYDKNCLSTVNASLADRLRKLKRKQANAKRGLQSDE